MIEVKCIGGECNGLSVKIEPQPTFYEVVDPRDRTRRDFYILEVGPGGSARSRRIGGVAGSDLKVVVITGASGGIGATLAKQLGARGDTVVLGARRPAELESVARDAGPGAVAVPTDVTKRADVDRLRDVALERCGQIDVWVNNAGRGITAPGLQLTDGQFDEMMAVNVKSALYGMQAIYPNVHVSLVMPGIVTTDFAANALGGTPWPRSSGGGTQFRGQTADEAAAAIVGLIDEPRDEIYTNPDQAETVRRYFEDVGAFEKQLQR